MEPKAILLRAAGTNCHYELDFCLKKAGFKTETAHVNEFIRGMKNLKDYDLLAIPGGFSGGDYLGAGKVFANKLVFGIGKQVQNMVDNDRLVIGICNGFQVLVKTGFLPSFNGERKQESTLAINESGGFQCEWIKMKALESKCIFTKGITELEVPIAHGEGRFYADRKIIEKLFEKKQVVFQYAKNPNGSMNGIAGICNSKGTVFGLMPHPERHNSDLNNPHSAETGSCNEGPGMKIFRNAFDYFRK